METPEQVEVFLENSPQKAVYWQEKLDELYWDLYRESSLELALKKVSDFWAREFKCQLKFIRSEKDLLVSDKQIHELQFTQYPQLPWKAMALDSKSFSFSGETGYVFLGLFIILEKLFEQYFHLMSSKLDERVYQMAFDSLPFAAAIVLLSENESRILRANDDFWALKLSVGELMGLEHGRVIQLAKKDYLVSSSSFVQGGEIFHFYSLFAMSDNPANHRFSFGDKGEELGIVTSSLAHELNNPLAGILAAATCLQMTLKSDESQRSLEEIKKSAQRAKQLVELFLGFSRPTSSAPSSDQTQFFDSAETVAEFSSASELFEQALVLNRFRLVQENLMLEASYQSQGIFGQKCNACMLTMVFYLTIHDLLTHIAHHGLVRSHQGTGQKISLCFSESDASVEIEVQQQLDLRGFQLSNSLAWHLLNELKLNFLQENKTLFFVKRPLL